ncbi:hypothetical protein BC834DRAFT_866660 [Gloeopeniophorella convolvens]|nr:hypothetical protein BC834DRAFT_866660 [Gloeopeniophorella convolvens]
MGLGDLIRGLLKVFCAPGQQQETQEPGYPTGAGKPSYAHQVQQPAAHPPPTQQQYPPQPQQWQPPAQQAPQTQPAWHQQQQQHVPPHPHKPHHGHGHGQGGQHHEQVPAAPQPIPAPSSPPQGQWASAPSPPSHAPSPRPHGHVDQNLVNQQNEHYVSLRARANQEGDAMARAFEQSHAAYARGDGAGAKELSNEGRAHQREMQRLNEEASAWIFRENNLDSKPGEIDLHGLYVKEAIAHTDRSIVEARSRGDREIHLIVGKGLHSQNHAAKLKPAIEELIQKHNLTAALDPRNSGVLIVQLDGGTAAEQARDRGGVMLGADDITQRLDGRDEGCVVM